MVLYILTRSQKNGELPFIKTLFCSVCWMMVHMNIDAVPKYLLICPFHVEVFALRRAIHVSLLPVGPPLLADLKFGPFGACDTWRRPLYCATVSTVFCDLHQ